MRSGQAVCPHCDYVLVPGDVHGATACSVLLASGQVISIELGCWFQGLLMECPLCHMGAVARTPQGRCSNCLSGYDAVRSWFEARGVAIADAVEV